MAMRIFRILLFLIINVSLVMLQKPSQTDHSNPTYYNIGGVLNNNESEVYFETMISVSTSHLLLN